MDGRRLSYIPSGDARRASSAAYGMSASRRQSYAANQENRRRSNAARIDANMRRRSSAGVVAQDHAAV